MNAFILVFSHPFFAMTDIDGRYRIDNVPPGAAWWPGTGFPRSPRPVTVPDSGATGSTSPFDEDIPFFAGAAFLTSALLAVLSVSAAVCWSAPP